MTFPNPAQRADWWTNNHEATHTNDQRYGQGHRPTYHPVGAKYAAACTCSTDCDRATDRLLHDTWHDALDAAKTNLAHAEHGPAAGQEHHP